MMQRREQYLIGAFLGAVLVWQVGGWMLSTVSKPFQEASEKLETLKKSVSNKQDSTLSLIRSAKLLKEWKAASLFPDPGKSKQPTALNAQRLYLEWITDLAELCGFDELKVQAGATTTKGKVYISVVVKLDAEARFEQLVQFLDLFYRTDLMQRISSLRVSTKVFEGDPQLRVSLEAEGLALLDVPSRRTVFPETTLTAQLSEEGTSLQVASAKEFPKEAGFWIKIKNEYLKTTAIHGETWEVERGLERTTIGSHTEGTSVELARLKSNQPRSLAELREMISNNIFVKPSPNYKMKLGPLGEKSFALGKPVEFLIAATGYDSLLGKPEFAIVGEAPAGLRIDRNGKLTWKVGSNVPIGKYPVTIEVRHPSAPGGSMTETVTIRLRESTASLKLADPTPPKAYLNREWTFQPKLIVPESLSQTSKFSWKLGDKSPKGVSIDSKTGELKWIPGDDVVPGELTIPLIITDSESPPQTTTLALKLNVEDDAAQFTRLTGIFSVGDKKRALLTDQSTDKKTELTEGDDFAISEFNGKIKSINGKYVVMTCGLKEVRWEVGQSLREAQDRKKY
jgi:hypothetical protein